MFNDTSSFCRKWQTAFELRLCGRIRLAATCFQPLSLHWAPLFFQCFFDVFWGPKKPRKAQSAAEPAPSCLTLRTKPLLLEPRFSASAQLRGLLHAA